MGPIRYTKMSVRTYHYTLRNVPQEHTSLIRYGLLLTVYVKLFSSVYRLTRTAVYSEGQIVI